MKTLGVSVYTGMEQTAGENIVYLKTAARLGYKKLFTSLHIPEADYRNLASECRLVLREAKQLGFLVTADISPQTWRLLNCKPRDLSDWGIDILRIDFGYSPAQIRQLLAETELRLEVNASTMTEDNLEKLLSTGIEPTRLCAGHNYYPRPETGLDFGLFACRSRCFRRAGIPVAAFIPGQKCRRGPLQAGLPTLESHRRQSVEESVRQLWASGLVDAILFGDPLVPAEDLTAVAILPRCFPEPLPIRIRVADVTLAERSLIALPCHTNRTDAAGSVIRSQESRLSAVEAFLPQAFIQPRRRGDITIDNSGYGRYAGELQIVLHDLPADARVNVVGQVLEADRCLLDCIFPGRAFRFEEVAE